MKTAEGRYGFSVGDWVTSRGGATAGETFQLTGFVPSMLQNLANDGYWRGDKEDSGTWEAYLEKADTPVRENKPQTAFPAHVEGRYGDSDWFKAGGFNSELTAESARDNFFAKMWPDFEFRVVAD